MPRMTKTARKRKAKAMAAIERKFAESNHRFIERMTQKGGDIVSRHDAKAEKKFTRHCNEQARFTSGFVGDIPTTGKELGPDYIGRFRTHDGARHVSMKAWCRKPSLR